MVRIDLVKQFWNVQKILEKWLERWMRQSLRVLLAELVRLTPENTREMVNSYRIEWLTRQWNNIVWTITNDADHAIYVEYGSTWLAFNYHKPKWSVFYTWVWNRTFARAIDNKRDEILQIIAKNLWL